MDAVSETDSDQTFRLLTLPGDGIGPEIITEILKIVAWFGNHLDMPIAIEHDLAGGASFDEHGLPITDAALQKALSADAILVALEELVAGPQWMMEA